MSDYKKAAVLFFVLAVSIAFKVKLSFAQEQTIFDNSLRPQVEFDAEEKRDCFMDYVTEEEPQVIDSAVHQEEVERQVNPPALTVQGIIWGTDLPQAIINNKVVRIEDIIEGARIIEIKQSGVTILFQKKIFIVPSPSILPVKTNFNQEKLKGGNNEKSL